MTTDQIREMIAGDKYNFLRENIHLNGRIIFLTLGGSYSYAPMLRHQMLMFVAAR